MSLPGLSIAPTPFLKWVGGKSQLLPQFEKFFPACFNHYYEPFLGGGAVFFHLRPDRATLNDANPNLIAAYTHIQNQLDDLLSLLYSFRRDYYAISPAEQSEQYYQMRERYNQLPVGALEKTALLIFMNKTGYNGLYRESKNGGYNVPFGRYDNPGIFEEANLKLISLVLQGVELLNVGFEEAVVKAEAGDFVYFDPPYMPLSKTASFTSYTRGDFGIEKQIVLAELAKELAGRGVLVMLSNSNSPLIRKLYRDFNQHEVKAGRAINSKAGGRGKITELVMTSYKV